MKKISLLMFMVLLYTAICSPLSDAVSGTELMESFSVRVTVIENEIEYEWEYDNPTHYEYEKGNTVQKGTEAKHHVDRLLNTLRLNEEDKADDYASRLKPLFPNIERLEIHWMNERSERYAWVWTKE